MANCELCGHPMPAGEEMFKFHGYSGPCPAGLPAAGRVETVPTPDGAPRAGEPDPLSSLSASAPPSGATTGADGREAIPAQLTVRFPDAVSLKMLDNENANLRRLLDECAIYLKDGETPAQCIARNRSDADTLLTLLAQEKKKSETQASAPPRAETPGWQPMETAPMDGTEVVALCNGDAIRICRYDEAWGPSIDDPGHDAGWWSQCGQTWPGCTHVRRDSHYYTEPQEQPTHWMPLPALPASTKE